MTYRVGLKQINCPNDIIYGRKHKTDDIEILIDGHKIGQVHHTKFLGDITDENLDWVEHINHCKKKITSSLLALRSATSYLTEHDSKSLYFTLVYPYMWNGIYIWGSASNTHLNSLVVAQKKAVRIHVVAKVSPNEHSQPLFENLRILPLNDLYYPFLGTFMFKQGKHMATIVIDDTVHNRDIHSYFTRSTQNVHTTFRRTLEVAKSFLNKGHHIIITCL